MDPVYPLHFTGLRVVKRSADGSSYFELTINDIVYYGESPVDDLPNKSFFMAVVDFGKRTHELTIVHNPSTRSGIAL